MFRTFYLANSSFTVLVLIPLVTFFIPLYSRIAFACPLLFPVLQKTITDGFPLNSFNLLSTSSSGIFTAPFTLPSANSCGVLTSTKNAPFATCSLIETSFWASTWVLFYAGLGEEHCVPMITKAPKLNIDINFFIFFYFLQNYFISESSYVTKVTIANFGFE